jgi:hypothetical protein
MFYPLRLCTQIYSLVIFAVFCKMFRDSGNPSSYQTQSIRTAGSQSWRWAPFGSYDNRFQTLLRQLQFYSCRASSLLPVVKIHCQLYTCRIFTILYVCITHSNVVIVCIYDIYKASVCPRSAHHDIILTVVNLTAAKFKPLIFSLSDLFFPSVASITIFTTLYGSFLLYLWVTDLSKWLIKCLYISLRLRFNCTIWGSHSGGYEEFYLLGYNAV